jgi:hypothetical protein
MDSISPVLTEKEVAVEQVIALGQDEYYPIIVARVLYSDGSPASIVRFRFTEQERNMIALGADLLISQPHHGALMPIGLQLAVKDSYPVIGD